MAPRQLAVLVTARNEEDRIGPTLAALAGALPGARLVVADDGSEDATAEEADRAGAEVVSAPRPLGKGGAATLGAHHLLRAGPRPSVVVLADADLGASAAALGGLVDAVEQGRGEIAVAVFARRVGGGFGLALAAARTVIRRRTGLRPRAPLSGQRALSAEALETVLPFARGFGMETAMTVDAHRAGFGLVELELPLEHRATGRTAAGYRHRARQLADILRVLGRPG